MKKHIRIVASSIATGAVIFCMATSVGAASAPAPGGAAPSPAPATQGPAKPGRPSAAVPATPPQTVPGQVPGTAPQTPTPEPAPGNNQNRPAPQRPGIPNGRPAAPAPVVPSARPTPAPGAGHNNNQGGTPGNQGGTHGNQGTAGSAASKLGNSTLSNLVEYYENLVAHGIINQESATRIIDYMLARYNGVSSNIGNVGGGKNKASSIQFEQRADGGATFFEQRADGKSIFFEQTPGKGAVYQEHNPFGSVNELNAAIVHSQMVNEGVITAQEAQAIANFDKTKAADQNEDK